MLDTLCAEDFEALRGQTLNLDAGQTVLAVEVAEVRRLNSPSPRATAPFAVVFLHPQAKGFVPQGIYRLDMPGRGAADLFVVPVGPDASGMRYEAVFN